MRYLVVALVALIMSGCASLDTRIAGVTESERFAQICATSPAIHLAFVALVSQTNVSQKIIDGEMYAYRVIETTCRSKPTNHVEALQTVLSAYQQILNAQAQAVRSAT